MATDKANFKTITNISGCFFFFFFFQPTKNKMGFIETEKVEDNNRQPLVFPDFEEEKITDELDDFIDNSEQPGEVVSSYRQLDPLNIDH